MYKAVFPNGSILAIKRFFSSQCSKRLFMSEVMTLGRLRHTNLVPLIGFCYETMEKLLVYKYMPNGNLYDWLHPPASELKIMKWPVRVKIAVGLARGLAWLHHYNRKLQISKLEKLVTRISFTELVNVIDNFREDNMIRLGKTGIMYKVVFPNGSFLAIKRFFESQFSEGHFMSEVMTLGRLRHNNLVPLFGFCYEGKEKLLVYKYMLNGNLYDWLHPPKCEFKTMKWPMRVKIAVRLARGLA
ncbi:putative leucine-rich repeat receptor-like protein kinase [Camellia lanceoleosa]|uniref:Leucine-rich repeat receptor-like protein kinase n=1 Tax=Camellia lanceoleosa TaxID=1840588 RepID=A0ACC0GWV8_9ERIC|nr:putative leucine-rich repeat receptor-like protein kinase [Camellia lanceoleosa]